MAFTVSMMGQVQTKTDVQHAAPSHQVKVERGEVVYVDGNDIVVKMDDGQIRHVTVPDNVTATVDGKQVTVHDLKPGMKLEKTITTTTTPRVVTTVKTVQGKVFHVTPPNSVILTLEDGTNKQFKIPKGQRFNVNGQDTDAWGLKKGMMISATSVTEVPETVVAQQIQRTGQAPPPPATPPMQAVLLIERPEPVAAAPAAAPEPAQTAAAEPAPAKLPKTGSTVPLFGLLGMLSLGASYFVRRLRLS
jgi:LPXTG-motif cell wall-anchored protein